MGRGVTSIKGGNKRGKRSRLRKMAIDEVAGSVAHFHNRLLMNNFFKDNALLENAKMQLECKKCCMIAFCKKD